MVLSFLMILIIIDTNPRAFHYVETRLFIETDTDIEKNTLSDNLTIFFYEFIFKSLWNGDS